jgi:hypothetical protein
MTREEIKQSLIAKLASPEIFTDAELTVGYEEGILGGNERTASDQSEGDNDEDAQLQKVAAALDALEIDEEIFKEAMELDPEVLGALIEQVAGEMPEPVSELILEKAAYDVQQMQEEEANLAKIGSTIGRYMFHAFNKEAAEHEALAHGQQEEEEVRETLTQAAPSIAAALGY